MCFAGRRHTLCMSSPAKCAACRKRPAYIRCETHESLPNKKGGGANQAFAPHGLPFRYERRFTVVAHYINCLRRQNLAALCTAAGKNLAAVGSSHSLTETVNLGSVATAGLIGTLHGVHLLSNHICSTAGIRPQQRIAIDHNWSC